MKVFVFRVLQICNYEIIRNSCEVYGNEIEAHNDFYLFVKDEKGYAVHKGWDISVDNENEFEAGEEGNYSRYATYASVEEKKI